MIVDKSAMWTDAKSFKNRLIGEGWKTPDTYGNEFSDAEDISAVYLFLLYGVENRDNLPDFGRAMVGYVGMSTHLRQRWRGHLILSEMRGTGRYLQRWFCPTASDHLRDMELKLIRELDPPWNLQGRKRGVSVI